MSTATKPINPLPKALTPDELDALRAVPKNPRDQALIEVMAGCGLRVSEALNLTLDALHWTTDKPALRFTGKRRKERIVPMNFEVQDAMRTWLDARDRIPNAGDFIFCHLRSGNRLSRQAVWMALDRYARQAGCRHVHPHMLRHSFGTALANGNVPVERIRELMGHASIEVSQIYISVSTEQKRQAVEQIDLRPRWLRWLSRQRNRTYRFFSRPVQRKTFSALTTSTGRLIDQLAGKFTIIAAMQYVKKAQGKHFWKFERLEVGPLASDEARRLIRQCAAGVEIEDERLFETHLLQKSAGNPRAIIESVERLRKEPAVTRNAVRELSHAGGRTQIDLTPIIIIPVLLLVALRFVARGLGDLEFYLFAGVGSALAVGVQFFLFRSRNR